MNLHSIYQRCLIETKRITKLMKIECSWDTNIAAYDAYEMCVKHFVNKEKEVSDAAVRYLVKRAMFLGGVPQGYKKKDKIKLIQYENI